MSDVGYERDEDKKEEVVVCVLFALLCIAVSPLDSFSSNNIVFLVCFRPGVGHGFARYLTNWDGAPKWLPYQPYRKY